MKQKRDDKVTLQVLIWVITAAVVIYIIVMLSVISREGGHGSGGEIAMDHDMESLLMEGFPNRPRNDQKPGPLSTQEAKAVHDAQLFEMETMLLKRAAKKSLRGSD